MDFYTACQQGDLDTAKRLVEEFPDLNIHEGGDWAFRAACLGGHLETAKWLVALGGVDVHTENDWAFRFACTNDHLETAKWLVESFRTVNVHAAYDHAFRAACLGGNLETARWVLSLDPEWEHYNLKRLKTWSKARTAWIHAVVSVHEI
jgi:hypothetical protein